MATPLHSQDIRQVVRSLADEVRRIETGTRTPWATLVTSGLTPFDRLLPEGGFRRGTLVEWLATPGGSGAGALALWVAARALAEGGVLVVVDRRGQFYAPAAVRLGIEPSRLIVVRPASDEDHAWAFDQVLRTRGVAAVWGEPPAGDDAMFRRWQLAAETSGVLGLLLRDLRARAAPSWAELRLVVTPVAGAETPARRASEGFPTERHQESLARASGWYGSASSEASHAARRRRLRVELARARGGRAGGQLTLELPTDLQDFEHLLDEQQANEAGSDHDETRAVPVAPAVAPATTGRKAGDRRRA